MKYAHQFLVTTVSLIAIVPLLTVPAGAGEIHGNQVGDNVSFGPDTLTNLTTGDKNTASGSGRLRENTVSGSTDVGALLKVSATSSWPKKTKWGLRCLRNEHCKGHKVKGKQSVCRKKVRNNKWRSKYQYCLKKLWNRAPCNHSDQCASGNCARGFCTKLSAADSTSRDPAAESISIIVRFKAPWQPEGNLGSNVERQKQRAQLKRAAALFIAKLRRYKPKHIRTYKTLPYVAMTVDRQTYSTLLKRRDVIAVHKNVAEKMSLGSSLPVVGANTVKNSGYGGAGQTVVIIDSGVDTNDNPNFAPDQIIAQGCFNWTSHQLINRWQESTTNICPGSQLLPLGTDSILTGDAANTVNAGDDLCTRTATPFGGVNPSGIPNCDHGTHVASIAAGTNGVAPGANIISLQVFSQLQNAPAAWFSPGAPFGPTNVVPPGPPPNTPQCGAGTGPNARCISAWLNDTLRALDEVVVLADRFDIAAVNMSIGNGVANIGACDGDGRKVAIDSLRSLGIATVISSGNDGFVNAMSAPACISSAISVSATVDTSLPLAGDNSTGGAAYALDNVTNFSNVKASVKNGTDLYAPGLFISGGCPAVSPAAPLPPAADAFQCSKSGTSMAAPHVTGAWAALKSLNPAAGVEDVLAVLQATGKPVTDLRQDTRNNGSWSGTNGSGLQLAGGPVANPQQIPRIQLDLAMERFDPHRGSITTGDFNCDGHQDIAMGSPNKAVNGQMDAGEVSILYGSSKGAIPAFNPHINQDTTYKNKKVVGVAEAGDRFGHSVAAGDFNGDGCDDLAVGVPYERLASCSQCSAGLVQVFYGSKLWGLDIGSGQIWHQNTDGIAGTAEDGDKFGWSLATGNLNGDKFMDLAIGSPTESVGSVAASGAVSVIYGSTEGLSKAGDQQIHQGNLEGLGAEVGDLFGYAVAIGDFRNYDGPSDLAIGAPRESFKGKPAAGMVTVLRGPLKSITKSGITLWHQQMLGKTLEQGDRFGFSLASGFFVNQDFIEDLVVGAPFEDIESESATDAGVVHIIPGSVTGLNKAGNTMWSQATPGIKGSASSGDRFGYSLASGYFNGDARQDLAVGVPFEDIESTSAVNAGAVNVILGAKNGLAANLNQLWYQSVSKKAEGVSEPFDRFGEALATGNIKHEKGSFPGNQIDDLVVRVSGEDNEVSQTGAVQIIFNKMGVGLSSEGGQLIKVGDL